MAGSLENAKQEFDREMAVLRSMQQELSKAVQSRNQFEMQYTETGSVVEELRRLDEDASVFKMVGTVLVRQDLVEAKANVGKRLEYIKADMDKLDAQIKALETRFQDKQSKVALMQRTLQQQQQPQAAA